jgi:hypothetical protein
MMKQAGSVKFTDGNSGDEAYVSVRYDEGKVALVVSLMQDGDIEVFMSKQDATHLLDALRVAVS